ncbi:hypothetical protein VWN47_10050, partial [Campylobacter jejuni]
STSKAPNLFLAIFCKISFILLSNSKSICSKILICSSRKNSCFISSLQSEFIRDAFGRIATSRIQNYEADNSTNAKEFDELPKGDKVD